MTFQPRMHNRIEGFSVQGDLRRRTWNGIVADLWDVECAPGAGGYYVGEDPRLIVLRYAGGGSGPTLGLVGKGVTFDTGGISIKPALGMEAMKWDRGGAGAVAGAMKALATRKAKANVIGVCGLVENMPDGNAQRPGDIVTSMSGQTIEVINTDA